MGKKFESICKRRVSSTFMVDLGFRNYFIEPKFRIWWLAWWHLVLRAGHLVQELDNSPGRPSCH